MENKAKQLKRNHRIDNIILLMSEPFITAHKDIFSIQQYFDWHWSWSAKDMQWMSELEVLAIINKALAGELAEVQGNQRIENRCPWNQIKLNKHIIACIAFKYCHIFFVN